MVMSAPTTALLFPSMTAQHKGCRTALDQWTPMAAMGGTCVAYGDQCPYNCPPVPFNDCSEQGMRNCPGPMDPMGCTTADTCVPLEEMCPSYCSYLPPMDCGEGSMNCPGPVDSMGC